MKSKKEIEEMIELLKIDIIKTRELYISAKRQRNNGIAIRQFDNSLSAHYAQKAILEWVLDIDFNN